MRLRFVFDEKKCSACAACAVACMDQNDIDVSGGEAPRRRVLVTENPKKGSVAYLSESCRHCEDAPCADVCPSGCLYRDGQTGLTLYEKDGCSGCGACEAACPYNAVCFDSDGKINKCDGCATRVITGLEPACVKVCPTGALTLAKED